MDISLKEIGFIDASNFCIFKILYILTCYFLARSMDRFIKAILSLTYLSMVSGNEMVTCTSIIKLQNVQRGVRLHSHEVKYGGGSGQQSVTGTNFLITFEVVLSIL
jgi:dolichyl-phosphate-mannose--protein O-mannosyl transferase